MLNLDQYFGTNTYCIPQKDWEDIKSNYSKEEIKEELHKQIESKSIPLPYPDLTLDDVNRSFKELQTLDTSTLWKTGDWFTRYDYKHQGKFSKKYIASCNIGNDASNFFHIQNRWKADSINSPSPERSWQLRKFRDTLFNALWTLKVKEVTPVTMRSAIALRKYIASQFRPAAAKAIFDHFKPKKVYDFSSGWGDRLAGFYACNTTESYTGVDVNTNLKEGYEAQQEAYNKIRIEQGFTAKKVDMLFCGAENYSDESDKFDLIFTSPPYFQIERYTQEDNQSWKHKKLDDWLEKFLFPSVKKAAQSLQQNRCMVINMSDVYCYHEVQKICDPMIDYLEDRCDMVLQTVWGMQMAKRMRSKSDKKGVFCEPVWVLQKQ